MQPKTGRGRESREAVAVGRARKRVDLSKQFDQFKQRIQQFENKNEEIISRIRDAYNVKKKPTQPDYRTAPILYPPPTHFPSQVYYQNNDNESVASSCDYSRDVVFEGSMAKHHSGRPARSIYQEAEARQNQSAQQLPSGHALRAPFQGTYEDYMRTQPPRLRTEEDRGVTSPDPTYSSGRFGIAEPQEVQIEGQYRQAVRRSQQLEQLLQQNQEELAKAHATEGRLRGTVAGLRRAFEDGLESFQEEVVGERFLQMEKYIRRCELRLKNLGLRLRDSLEERRARRLIGRSRSKRNSLSKPRNKELSLSDEAQSTPKVSRAHSQSRCRRSDNPAKNREFEQIAVDYENMIKSKAGEVEALERRLNEEVRVRDGLGNELMRAKVALEEKERELIELRKRKPVKEQEQGREGKQARDLRERLVRVEEELRAREGREKQLSETVARLQKAKKALHEEYTENLSKNKSLKQKAVQQLQARLRESEAGSVKQAGQLRERLAVAEKKLMEKQCELLAVANRLKKCENERGIKEEKLRELEGLLLRDNDHAELLDRSVSIDSSMLSHAEVRHLQDSLRRVEEELEERKALLYDLQKEKYLLEGWRQEAEAQLALHTKTNAALEQRVSDLLRQLDDCQLADERGAQRELDEKAELLEELEAEKQLLLEEKEELAVRNSELMENLKRAKENNLTANRELIKLNSELTFTRNEQANAEVKLAKAKEELSSLWGRLESAVQERSEREVRLESEGRQLRQEVENLRNHLLEVETLANRSPQDREEDILLNSLHVSEISFNYQPTKPTDEDPAALRERLREVQAALEIKAGMEEQVQAEYRANLDRLRADAVQRQRELEDAQGQLEQARAELSRERGSRREDESFENLKLQVYEQKIVQMEEDYAALKESEERLNEMLHQILETIKQREEEKERLVREAEDKDRLLEEMRELLELKDSARFDPTKTNKSDTLRDFSLRVSGDHSEELVDANELSYLSNISDVFKKDDVLQERIRRGRTGREEQAKLFARTAAYIRSLKAIIEGKEKRVKVLEKQLTAVRAQEGQSWSDREHSNAPSHHYRTEEHAEDLDQCDEFKDYDSVQLDTRRSKYTELVKILQHEKNLAVEENKLLNNQIQALQDELLRSEQQENSLVRIKDLYKDEIKKLIEKNEAHTKEFETQIHKLKEQLEASESFHNLEAIRQLFIKIVPAAAFLDDPTAKPARRDEKRKELEEYVKVMSSILQLETPTRDRLLASLKK